MAQPYETDMVPSQVRSYGWSAEEYLRQERRHERDPRGGKRPGESLAGSHHDRHRDGEPVTASAASATPAGSTGDARRAPGDGRPRAAGADDPGPALDAVHAPRPHRGSDVPGLPRAWPPGGSPSRRWSCWPGTCCCSARRRTPTPRRVNGRPGSGPPRGPAGPRGTAGRGRPARYAHRVVPGVACARDAAGRRDHRHLRAGRRPALRPVRRRPAPRRRRLIRQRPCLQLSPQFAGIVADDAGRDAPMPRQDGRLTAAGAFTAVLIAALVAAVIAAVVAPGAGRSRSHGDGPPARRARSPGLLLG